jgi:hypothetical protein
MFTGANRNILPWHTPHTHALATLHQAPPAAPKVPLPDRGLSLPTTHPRHTSVARILHTPTRHTTPQHYLGRSRLPKFSSRLPPKATTLGSWAQSPLPRPAAAAAGWWCSPGSQQKPPPCMRAPMACQHTVECTTGVDTFCAVQSSMSCIAQSTNMYKTRLGGS